ncbi:erythromycin esterase family protein [Dyadobacter sp. LHD-138]|uniref:erythromycin esterase family protein n=1 Tax=Dyadobacter sp. LHD-138 TaxID=3071413 RepID=UPI0027DF10D4|nr:erythromycin esterase family protein [Dyadobacter sp. LHD-138]MDQ6481895.1 erythromycin esterase family protein [Dyadobacter sp. LHD-138]
MAQSADNFTEIIKANAMIIDPKILSQDDDVVTKLEKSIHFGDYKVLAMGEQSHGTSEFFKTRTNLIRLLVARKQLTKIGLEAPMPEVDLLNKFVAGEGGNLKDILKSFRLYSYECSEFMDLVEAVKTINVNRRDKIIFFGFDVQSPFQSLQNMLDYSAKNNPATVDSLQKLINNYKLLNNEMYAHTFSEEDFNELNTLSEQIMTTYDPQSASSEKSDLLKKSINNYRQFLLINNPYVTKNDMLIQSVIRDSLMAVNVLSEITDADKIIILAHNAHIQKTVNVYSKSMGYYLSNTLGKHYKCLGSTTSTGFYTAYNPAVGKITDMNKIQTGDQDTFEFFFSRTEKPIFFLNTSQVVQQLKNVTTPTKYRLLVYGYTEQQFVPGNVLADYDFVLHIDRTTGNKSFYLK